MSILTKTTWIPISNESIYNNLIRQIGKKGFSTLCFLMILSQNENTILTTIKLLQQSLNIKKNNDMRNILEILQKNNLISFVPNNINIQKHKYTDSLTIHINYKENFNYKKGYEMIPVELFHKYYKTIGYNGWSILCTLAIYNNYEYGYSFPSYFRLQENLKMSPTTLNKYINILIDQNLIKVNPSKNYEFEINNFNTSRFSTNQYIVKYMYEKIWLDYIKSLNNKKE